MAVLSVTAVGLDSVWFSLQQACSNIAALSVRAVELDSVWFSLQQVLQQTCTYMAAPSVFGTARRARLRMRRRARLRMRRREHLQLVRAVALSECSTDIVFTTARRARRRMRRREHLQPVRAVAFFCHNSRFAPPPTRLESFSSM